MKSFFYALIWLIAFFPIILSAQKLDSINKGGVKHHTLARIFDAQQTDFIYDKMTTAKALAKELNRQIFVDVYTDWCQPCRKMTAEAFNDGQVADLMNGFFVNLKVNAEKGGRSIAFDYGVRAYPTVLFLNQVGQTLDQTSGYMGVGHFKNMLERKILFLPGGADFIALRNAFDAGERQYVEILKYMRLRKVLSLSNDNILKTIVTEMPDSFKLNHYQQLVSGFTQHIEGFGFDYLSKNKTQPIYQKRIEKIITLTFEYAIEQDDAPLLKKAKAANDLFLNTPSVSEEQNKHWTFLFHLKNSKEKKRHETAADLMESHYLTHLDTAKTQNDEAQKQKYVQKISALGKLYIENIKDTKLLSEMAAMVNRACQGNECAELISIYGQLLYRANDKSKGVDLLKKAVNMSNNAADLVEILAKMEKNAF